MITSTFSYEELLKTMQKAASLLQERCEGYAYHNQDTIFRRAKKQALTRVVSCEIEHQRYYQKFFIKCEGKRVGYQATSAVTVFLHENRKYVICYNPLTLHDQLIPSKIRIFTEHYLNRYFERNKLNPEGLELHEMVQAIFESSANIVPASIDDNVIKRYGEPALKMNFLSKEERFCECVYLDEGDISIVESYGPVSVWRTFISKDMLFESQKEDECYKEAQTAIDIVNRRISRQ